MDLLQNKLSVTSQIPEVGRSYGPASPSPEIPKTTPVPAEKPKPALDDRGPLLEDSKAMDRYEPSLEAERYQESLKIHTDAYKGDSGPDTGADNLPMETEINREIIAAAQAADQNMAAMEDTTTQGAQQETSTDRSIQDSNAASQVVQPQVAPEAMNVSEPEQPQEVEQVATASAVTQADTAERPDPQPYEAPERPPVDAQSDRPDPVDRPEPVDRPDPVERPDPTQGTQPPSPSEVAAEVRTTAVEVESPAAVDDVAAAQEVDSADAQDIEVEQGADVAVDEDVEVEPEEELGADTEVEPEDDLGSDDLFEFSDIDMATMRTSLMNNDLAVLDSMMTGLNNASRQNTNIVQTEDWFSDALTFSYAGKYLANSAAGVYGNQDTETDYTTPTQEARAPIDYHDYDYSSDLVEEEESTQVETQPTTPGVPDEEDVAQDTPVEGDTSTTSGVAQEDVAEVEITEVMQAK